MTRTMRTILGVIAAMVLSIVGALALGGSGRAATQAAPSNTAPPTVTGTTTVGQTLTASNGTWTNSPTSYSYAWLRCDGSGGSCVAVTGATEKTYTLVAADRGHTMRVRVTATNADGSASAESAATNVVAAASGGTAPKNTALPAISGTPKVGEELSTSQGSWTGNPTGYRYQWQRCDADVLFCTDVIGATGSTYGVRIADLGFRLRVEVTARNAAGTGTARSAPTAIVGPTTPPPNGRPTITIVSVRFVGATVYTRFRVCDDSFKSVTILATDSRPGKLSYTRRFTTLVAPRPCGVYTRHWLPAPRFRGPGSYTITLKARDKSGLTSLPARRHFTHG
jgi:hypothetical protein